MSPSYQTIPPATSKDEPSSTPVPMMKKVAVVAMVGTALVVGYSYGASTNPARINIATTTTATNLVRGGVRNGDAGQEDWDSYCVGLNEKACKGQKECQWVGWGRFGRYSCMDY